MLYIIPANTSVSYCSGLNEMLIFFKTVYKMKKY